MKIGEILVGSIGVDWPQAESMGTSTTILADANVRDVGLGSLFIDSLVIGCTVGLPIVALNPDISPLAKTVEVFALAQPGFWWTAHEIWQSPRVQEFFSSMVGS